MNSISKICVALVRIIPTAWVMLGLEYGACWWEHHGNAYELVMSVGGTLLIAWAVLFVGEHLARNGEVSVEVPSLKSCAARIAAEILILAVISSALGQ